LDSPAASWKEKLASINKVPLDDKIIFSNNFKVFQGHERCSVGAAQIFRVPSQKPDGQIYKEDPRPSKISVK